MLFVSIGITVGTPVPETAMKFVHRVGVVGVPIHEVSQGGDAILARIARVLNVMALRAVWADLGHETVVRCLTFRAELIHTRQDLLAS